MYFIKTPNYKTAKILMHRLDKAIKKELHKAEQILLEHVECVTDPWELIDLGEIVEDVVKQVDASMPIFTIYDPMIKWTTRGVYVDESMIVDYCEDGEEGDYIAVNGTYVDAFYDDAEAEWAKFCEPLYPPYEWDPHDWDDDAYDEPPDEAYPIFVKKYRDVYPEWKKVYESKK